MLIILFIISAYVIGSLSSAILTCRVLNLPDPRSTGSMNPGATNVLRIGGKIPALITLLGDASKGLIPVLAAKICGLHEFYIGCIALAAFLGHLFPVFFNFHGGKGVATTFGIFLAITPTITSLLLILWLLIAVISRYSSLASIITITIACIVISLGISIAYLPSLCILTILILWRHRENIASLREGTERKINLL